MPACVSVLRRFTASCGALSAPKAEPPLAFRSPLRFKMGFNHCFISEAIVFLPVMAFIEPIDMSDLNACHGSPNEWAFATDAANQYASHNAFTVSPVRCAGDAAS